MKILIADDEAVTRNGLLSAIDWPSLGITTVLQAEDGLQALEMARREQPDIILSDVRMPRMNGLEMVAALEALLPDTAVIFMSGYSDKEYLKTAIRLRAITYVEKPIMVDELIQALKEACEQVQQKARSRVQAHAYSHEQLRNLGRLLTRPLADTQAFTATAAEAGLDLTEATACYPLMIRFRSLSAASQIDHGVLSEYILGRVRLVLSNEQLSYCYTISHEAYLALFLFCERSFGQPQLQRLLQMLDGALQDQVRFQICAGPLADRLSRIHEAYTQAVILSQRAFFVSERIIAELPEEDNHSALSESVILSDFRRALDSRQVEQVQTFLNELHQRLRHHDQLLPPQCKDLYYRLALEIEAVARRLKQTFTISIAELGLPLLEAIDRCFTYAELHNCLTEITGQYFDSLKSQRDGELSIFLIKDFIHAHFAEESLSIKQISEHVFLSVSYLCTYFKAQTGQTINQYITDYRMELACRLLEDGRIPINDIAARVGYSNSNYFGKGFKKHTGQTPSAYRDSRRTV